MYNNNEFFFDIVSGEVKEKKKTSKTTIISKSPNPTAYWQLSNRGKECFTKLMQEVLWFDSNVIKTKENDTAH